MIRNILLLAILLLGFGCAQPDPQISEAKEGLSFSIASKADPLARLQHDMDMLVDPATGRIPEGMRQKELDFFRDQHFPSMRNVTAEWQSRGPWNVGGRTRAFAIDHSNENVMIAGGASGGIWKSVDAGQSWYKVTGIGTNTAVTSLIQDPREGHELEWYFTTGELFGASQSGVGAFYLGNGVYKSEDGGESWEGIAATQQNSPQSFNSVWEGLWRIAVDPSNMDSTVLYVAGYGTLWRSFNGGDNWSAAISSNSGGQSSYFSDVTVTSDGVVYATLSYENEIISFGLGPGGGVYRSTDGSTFTDIRPDDYPEQFSRTVIGVNPSDENEVYFLAANVDSTSGFQGEFFNGGIQYSALWKYNYLSGDGTGAGAEWTELTENLPADTGIFDDFYPQSGYDLAIGVSPSDPQTVVIGGTNLYRSTDGFSTSENNRFIGGYAEHSSFPDFGIYEGHHPDMHGVFFPPTQPGRMYNFNDGGIFVTDDISADTVDWISLNQGYLTTQVYGLGIDIDAASSRVVAGLQDNGNHFVNSPDPQSDWTLPLNGDGCYTFFAREDDYALLSIQNGRVFKCELSDTGELLAFDRIDPGLEQSGHDFIHPYAISPNDDGTVYFPYQNKLYVHRGIDTVAMAADYEANLSGWEVFVDSIPVSGLRITSITPAEDGTDRIYLGTSEKRIYRIDDATDLSSPFVDITAAIIPSGHIDCIATDPFNGDVAIAVLTNYGLYSLFVTTDAGVTWDRAGGNLEQTSTGAGNGPSCRWATIHRWHPDSVVYYVGTSIGLFSTSELDGFATEWQQESTNQIGNTVVSYVASRAVDKRVFAGTHGGGVFDAVVEQLSLPSGVEDLESPQVLVYPNPAQDEVRVIMGEFGQESVILSIMDANGKKIREMGSSSNAIPVLQISDLAEGTYYIQVRSEKQTFTVPFIKTR